MPVVAILVGMGVLFYVLESQQKGMFAALLNQRNRVPAQPIAKPAPLSTQFVSGHLASDQINLSSDAGVSDTAGLANQAAGLGGTGLGAAGAITPLGPIGAIAGAGLAVIGAITGVISKHHKEAVAHEAGLLNNAVPRFAQDIKMLRDLYVQKRIDRSQLFPLLDQIRNDYYTNVSQGGAGSITGRWPWAKGVQAGYKYGTSAYYWGKPNDFPGSKPRNCNGPCVVAHFWVEGPIEMMKESISKNRHDAIVLGPIPSHAGFQGLNSKIDLSV